MYVVMCIVAGLLLNGATFFTRGAEYEVINGTEVSTFKSNPVCFSKVQNINSKNPIYTIYWIVTIRKCIPRIERPFKTETKRPIIHTTDTWNTSAWVLK